LTLSAAIQFALFASLCFSPPIQLLSADVAAALKPATLILVLSAFPN